MDEDTGSSPSNLEQCRICHDEDEDTNLEMPCSCRGSLKYAHQKCVQRWCNVKGNTTCEICCQQFKPGYTAPSPLFRYGGFPMNFRGNWEMPRRDLQNPHFIAMVTPPDHNFLDPDFDDYPAPNPISLLCCRIVAISFMLLLVMRHTLPLIISGGAGDDLFTLVMLPTLSTLGIVLPVYIMVKAFAAIQRRRFQQDPRFSAAATSDEENELPQQLRQQPPLVSAG